jgi:predicted transcriptional regulator of viral defense system
MDYISKIKKILEKKDVITAKMVTDEGIPRTYLKTAMEQGLIERVARGLYVDRVKWQDDMLLLQLRYAKGIFSFNTALYLFDLTDVTPEKYDMTFPQSYRAKSLVTQGIHVTTMVDKYYKLGITSTQTTCGNMVNCYDKEKTICDLVRRKSQNDIRIVTDALKFYARRKDKNLLKLMEYAKIMNIDEDIRKYFEVLL